MRVTGKMLRDKVLYNIQAALERMQAAQTQAATGKRLLKPSDDAIAVAKTLKVKDLLRDNEQYQRNMDDATGWMQCTEPALDGISSIIIQLKEIAVAGASDTKDVDERTALAEQVEGLLKQMLGLANTQYDQRYVFSGTYTLTRPYEEVYAASDEAVTMLDTGWSDLTSARLVQGSVVLRGSADQLYVEGTDYEVDYATGRLRRLAGGSIPAGEACEVTYQSEGICRVDLTVATTDGALRREIGPGVWEKINIGGEEFLDADVDVFALANRIKNALYKNDGVGVNGTLDDLDAALGQVSIALGAVGLMRESFTLAEGRLATQNVNLQALASGLEDADLAEVAVRLQAEQTAYQSALSAAASILNTSLINFID